MKELKSPREFRRVLRWIDSDDELMVAAPCRGACRVSQADVRAEPFRLVVSPSGIAHHSNEYGDTDCGHDATRDGWWWPE